MNTTVEGCPQAPAFMDAALRRHDTLRHPGESRDLGETRRDFSSRGPGFRRDDG
jgi:hypothetical protein